MKVNNEVINWLESVTKNELLSIIKNGLKNSIIPKDIDVEDVFDAIGCMYIGEEYHKQTNTKIYIEEEIINNLEDIEELFDNTSIEDYKKLIGKCFSYKNDIVIKVIGIRDDFNNKYYEIDNFKTHFLYEQFEFYNGGWHIQDYIWLQEQAKGKYPDESYLKFCITPYTEMNISREGMYILANNGDLYVDEDCEYRKLKPIDIKTFEAIRKEAIENDGEYEIQWK